MDVNCILFVINLSCLHAASVNFLQDDDQIGNFQAVDPLECCDISAFISPSALSKCNFRLIWLPRKRLVVTNRTQFTTLITLPSMEDISTIDEMKILPDTCSKEKCVFEDLKIVSEAGKVDLIGFSKLLDEMTLREPSWLKAKARVITHCLTRPIDDYEADCEISKILSCTFDLLSENCPYIAKPDPCKRKNTTEENAITCQISTSKVRPKNRRSYCALPSLVPKSVLAKCDLSSIARLEYTVEASRKENIAWENKPQNTCIESSSGAKCLLNEMNVLNKYNFIDHLKMKTRIRDLAQDPTYLTHIDIYLNAFNYASRYKSYCSATKKLLNVIDSMVTTCQVSKRSKTPECIKLFEDAKSTD